MIVAADDRRRPSFTHPTVPVCSAGRSGEARVWQASPSVARIFRFRIQTCARWRTCSGPPGVARGGMQVAWRGRSHLAPPAHPSGPGGARAPALHVWRGGRGRWLGGAEATWSHLPTPRWRTCSSPPRVAREGGQVAWRGLKPPVATCPGPGGARAPALHVWRGGRGRWLGGGRSPWRHPSAHMATGGVWNLLQVLFALFCPWPQAA